MSTRSAGLAAAALVIAVSLAALWALEPATFTGPVSLLALCAIPVQIVLALALGEGAMPAVAALPRAARGVLLLALTVVLGGLVLLVVRPVVATGRDLGFPGLAMYCIVAVVTALWLVVVCGGWPFTLLPGRWTPVAAVFAAVHLVAFTEYRLLFDFTAFGLPSGPGLSTVPGGLFDAWHMLVFLVTAISGLFLAPVLGLGGTSGATRAVTGTGLCLAWGALLYTVGVALPDADAVGFLLLVPVPLLFGGLIVVVLCRGGFYPGRPHGRWAKGVATLATAAAAGAALVWAYRGAAAFAHPGLVWGAPRYTGEIWVANATLALTFGLLSAEADFFGLWPFHTAGKPDPDRPAVPVRP